MARELSRDPYVPLIGTLPADATVEQARDWLGRQRDKHEEGAGFSFIVVRADTRMPIGSCGLWPRALEAGHASAGYSIVPSARGHGFAADALRAVTTFAWSIPNLWRVDLHVEPWNIASVRTAESAGYQCGGLLRGHSEIGGRRRDMLLFTAVRPGHSSG